MVRALVFFCSLFFLSPILYAQSFGGFSPRIKWMQINSDAVRVIYPEGLSHQANRVASLINHIDQNNRTTIGNRYKKLDLVLNNQGVIPNGYVTLMPYRSEFFTIPMQSNDLGSLPWLDLLSIHEYRHALQYINFRKGVTNLGYMLMGEGFWTLAIHLTIPDWFFEGDAVVTETALTRQGRGRLPAFLQGYESILATRKPYSYQRVRNGSYRLDIPDHYRLGYLLTSYGRNKYGDDLWMRVIDRTVRFKGLIYPFSKALKKETGLRTPQFYREAMLYYQAQWDSLAALRPKDPSSRLTPDDRRVVHFDYPLWDKKTQSWFATKSSFSHTPSIVQRDTSGPLQKIVDLGIQSDKAFSLSDHFLAWSEISWNRRYSTISYSDIVLFDRECDKTIRLTHEKRYFSPSLSPVDNQIVVVHSLPSGIHELLIIDSQTGATIKALENSQNLYLTYPQWSADGKKIYVIARNDSGESSILYYDSDTGKRHHMAGPFNHVLGRIAEADGKLFLSASFEGRENIYSLNPETFAFYKCSQSRFGATHPAISPSLRQLCYVDFHHSGKNLQTIDIDRLSNQSVELTGLDEISPIEDKFVQIEEGNILDQVNDMEYKEKRYQPDLHALKLHSWMPTATFSSLGLALISDNIFSNIHLEGQYEYYLNEHSHGFSINAIYGRIFPILSGGYSQGYRSSGSDDDKKLWERSISADIQVPLDFSSGRFYKSLTSDIGMDYVAAPQNPADDSFGSGKTTLASLNLHAQFQISQIKAKKNIATPLGFGFEINAQKSIWGATAKQVQLFLDGSLRGILPNQNLVFGMSLIQENSGNSYQYIDLNAYPRGYEIPDNNWLSTWQINYHFPLFYPDFGIAGLVYFSRVRANFFLDYAMGETYKPGNDQWGHQIYQSIGVELISDMNLINLLPLSLGARLSVLGLSDPLNPDRSSFFEIFIPVIRL